MTEAGLNVRRQAGPGADHDEIRVGSCSPSATIESLHIVAAGVLAAFPWVHGFGLLEFGSEIWLTWVGVLGAHALLMLVWPARGRLVPALSLLAVLGLCFIQATVIYFNIVTNNIQKDYALLATWLAAASQDLSRVPATLLPQGFSFTYFQYYFDPIVPQLNRVFLLSDDPVHLLGFQLLAVLAAPIITWYICVHVRLLRSFQLLLPSAFLLHPSLVGPLQSDYHSSTIGLALHLAGTYAFWTDRRRSAFLILLLGTLTRVSFWPCWLMFGLVHGVKRQWAWALVYGAVGLMALFIYHEIQPQRPQGSLGLRSGFGYLGRTHAEVAVNALMQPGLWIETALHPIRWQFFLMLFFPFGFAIFRRPAMLVPIAPLAALSLLDTSGWRALVFNTYAIEYLGFLVAGTLLALCSAGRKVCALATVAMTLGLLFTLSNPYEWFERVSTATRTVPFMRQATDKSPPSIDNTSDRIRAENYIRNFWPTRFAETRMRAGEYAREVDFSACAVGDAPVIVTNYRWASYVRGQWDQIWFDEGGRSFDAHVWRSVETLVGPSEPHPGSTFVQFPHAQSDHDIARYKLLVDRLPVAVTTHAAPHRWRYFGGERLAACAARFGYEVEPNPGASRPFLSGMPD